VAFKHGRLEPQPSEFQTEFKLSYYAHDLEERFLAQLRCDLAGAGHFVEIVYSSNRDLDVLPLGVNKGSAVLFLASLWGVCFDGVTVAGDTGNDYSMLAGGFKGIVVGNAQPELKLLRSPNIYHSPYSYATGVLDGMDYWMNRKDDGTLATNSTTS